MRIDVITTFPEMFDSVMGASIMRLAQKNGHLDFRAHDLRDWTHDVHRKTDDKTYGGGPGLVMKCQPVFDAVEDVIGIPRETLRGQKASEAAGADNRIKVVMASPHGTPFDDRKARELSGLDRIVFVCGHYEGMDERIYSAADEIISIGDYVLTSGELSSMVIIDAIVRKIPGVLGAENGALDESFADGMLEYPQYTRPSVFRGMEVPEILLSGDHAKVDEWRRRASIERTKSLRPDLLQDTQTDPFDGDDDARLL